MFNHLSSSSNSSCLYDNYPNSPEVYFVNLKNSTSRHKSVVEHLSDMKFNHFRVEGVESTDIYAPNDILTHRQPNETKLSDVCKYKTKEIIRKGYKHMHKLSKKYLVTGLCTQAMRWTELYCSMAHLIAIYRAVHSTSATSKYAIIMEDDVYIPISTDYNALAASAPGDFGLLQLMTIDLDSMKGLWAGYLNDPTQFWTRRDNDMYYSTGLYLINRAKLRPIIDAIVHIDPHHPGIIHLRLIAAWPKSRSDVPQECTRTYFTAPSLACIRKERLIADEYIYALAPSYVSNIPIAYAEPTFNSTVQVSCYLYTLAYIYCAKLYYTIFTYIPICIYI